MFPEITIIPRVHVLHEHVDPFFDGNPFGTEEITTEKYRYQGESQSYPKNLSAFCNGFPDSGFRGCMVNRFHFFLLYVRFHQVGDDGFFVLL